MKKTLVALAALAAATGAFAQSGNARAISGSGVAIFGGLDARVNYLTATNAGSLSRLDNSGEYSSRLGFRGMEDIGGGWAAGFWLEAGVGNDDGRGQNSTSNNTNMGQNFSTGAGTITSGATTTSTQLGTPSSSGLNGLQGLTFNRASVVSLLNKGFGEIRVGRDYAPTFWNLTVYDPFGTVGVGSSANVTLGTLNPAGASIAPPGTAKPQIRTSNSVGWLSNDMSGFRVQLQYAFSEVVSNCIGLDVVASGQSTANSCLGAKGDGKYIGGRIQYNSGPISVALATGTTSYSSNITADTIAAMNTSSINWLNAGGNAQFVGEYKATNFGGTYDAGVAKFFVQYGQQVSGGATGATLNTAGTSWSAATESKEAILRHTLLGVTVPQGNMLYKLTYNTGTRTQENVNDRSQSQTALGAVYSLSKRTSLYGTYSYMSASGVGATASQALTSTAVTAASGNVKATGYDIGISHRF